MHSEMYGKEETIRHHQLHQRGRDKDDVGKHMELRAIWLDRVEGGFINGGKYRFSRPNTFIVPQGRCAEALYLCIKAVILQKRWPGSITIHATLILQKVISQMWQCKNLETFP